jgi:predicted TPR repeat methyltransferase
MDTEQVTVDAGALCIRAAQLVDSGRFGAAKPLLAAVRALAPSSPELVLISARIALGTGAWEQALADLDEGIGITPSHAGLRKCRADVRQRLGDREGAARDAAEAVVLDPSDPEAKAILGAAMLDCGRIADAIDCFADAVEGAPNDLGWREALASALERAGDPNAALRVLTDGIALVPAGLPVRNAAILLCIRQRDFDRAVRLADQARLSGIADACTLGMAGHALSSMDKHGQAAIAYEEALKLAPEDPYVRHLAASSREILNAKRAPDGYIRAVFDGYADRFESHLVSLRYGIPDLIRNILLAHPAIASGRSIESVLDLGCGTGLVALALGGLSIESFTGVDLSPRMLARAKAKRIYAELRESDIVAYLTAHLRRWPLIVAADVLCYFGALDTLLGLVRQRLEPNGWFIFSVEQMLRDHDGVVSSDGNWALQRQGRYAHADHYVYEAVCAAGFRVIRMDRPIIRQEAGTDVPGLLLTIERTRHDD